MNTSKEFSDRESVEMSGAFGAEAVMAPRSDRKEEREYNRHLDKDRDPVGRFINRVEPCRRIATRYEQAARD